MKYKVNAQEAKLQLIYHWIK